MGGCARRFALLLATAAQLHEPPREDAAAEDRRRGRRDGALDRDDCRCAHPGRRFRVVAWRFEPGAEALGVERQSAPCLERNDVPLARFSFARERRVLVARERRVPVEAGGEGDGSDGARRRSATRAEALRSARGRGVCACRPKHVLYHACTSTVRIPTIRYLEVVPTYLPFYSASYNAKVELGTPRAPSLERHPSRRCRLHHPRRDGSGLLQSRSQSKGRSRSFAPLGICTTSPLREPQAKPIRT